MKINTFSVVVGTSACNAKCPFCVSAMTGQVAKNNNEKINWRNFLVAARLAKHAGVTTAMLTGKGEPTLFPEDISEYICQISAVSGAPLIELQTNGIILSTALADANLKSWYGYGLTTIAVSVVSCDQEENAAIYGGKHYDLSALIKKLHGIGFSVRLSVILLKDNCDYSFFNKMIDFAKTNDVEQMTFIPLNAPENSANETTKKWVNDNQPSCRDISLFVESVEAKGNRLLELAHGAVIYDYEGQNVCLSNCLTKSENNGEMRNLIVYPNGRIMYDWQYKGAIIL